MIKLLSGNKAAANGVLLSRPDVIALYPITPQTPLVEELDRMHADGILDCEMIQPEGENSSMSIVIAASVAGGRVFTATSSWGLAFMNEPMMYCAGMRVPVVMVNVNRETPHMRGVSSSRQDIMSIRDSGWLQVECETCQEILDSVIMAYRLAEDPDILLPLVVAYDGYYLSHLSERVDVPEQAAVDDFLLPVRNTDRNKLTPGSKLCFGPSISEHLYAEYRYKAGLAYQRVKKKLPTIEKEFADKFGRFHGGMVDTYRIEDAEYLLVTVGSCAGTARVAVDKLRSQGLKVGLVRIRMFRPFPRENLQEILEGRKGIGVLDRSVCLGWGCGHIYAETRAVLPDLVSRPKMVDFIDGISNLDVTVEHLEKAFDLTIRAANGEDIPETTWLMWE